jgi:hypothetical protein
VSSPGAAASRASGFVAVAWAEPRCVAPSGDRSCGSVLSGAPCSALPLLTHDERAGIVTKKNARLRKCSTLRRFFRCVRPSPVAIRERICQARVRHVPVHNASVRDAPGPGAARRMLAGLRGNTRRSCRSCASALVPRRGPRVGRVLHACGVLDAGSGPGVRVRQRSALHGHRVLRLERRLQVVPLVRPAARSVLQRQRGVVSLRIRWRSRSLVRAGRVLHVRGGPLLLSVLHTLCRPLRRDSVQ